MIIGMHHTAISVPDLDRALAFYTEALGFELIAQRHWIAEEPGSEIIDAVLALKGSAARVGILKHSNCFLELFEFSKPLPRAQNGDRPACDHGLAHLAFEVTDIEHEYERLGRLGMRWHNAPVRQSNGTTSTYGRDPFGNIIEITERPGPDTVRRTTR